MIDPETILAPGFVGKQNRIIMTITGFKNGNKITWNQKKKSWFYDDGGESKKERPCPKCGKLPIGGIDACLSKLPGVRNACCGHGVEPGYIQFENGVVLRFNLLGIE